jgi:tetratricopeptide (TPR) repeat protein
MSHPAIETVLRKTRRTSRTEDVLRLELAALQTAITEQERKGLKSPILTEKDFAVRLPQIKRAYKETRFDSYLRSATKHLHDYLKNTEKQETYEYWKARTLLYELNDTYNISPEINEATLNDGQRVLEELRMRSVRWDKGSELPRNDRKILREKVLLCACRGNELKRLGETALALNLFEWLMDFTNKLRTDTFPCYSTRATLCYHMGTTLRAMEQHKRAEAMYSKALDLLYARGKKLGPSDHLYVTRKQAMVVGLGFGWVNMTRGFLARAEHALTTARSMLASVDDPLVSSFVELLYGTIQRCRAGSDKTKLAAVISQLQLTRRGFMDHPRYQARTCWELALAKAMAGDISGAQEDLRFVALNADRTSNQKWQVNVQILQSRIYQKQGRIEDALALAEAAVDKAKSPDCKTILPLVDAYLTRGEAYLSLADTTKSETHYLNARGSFESALQCMLDRKFAAGKPDYFANPKIGAVCALRIAQCYARTGKQVNAKKHFATWLRLEPNVEHEWVRELSEKVRTEIDRLSVDFAIPASDPHKWSYSENVDRLRRWLLTQSLRHTNQNYSEAAKLIGVQRTTLYQWQTQVEAGKRRRARTSDG